MEERVSEHVHRNLHLKIFWKVTLQLQVFTLNCRWQYNKSLKIIWFVIVIFGMSPFFSPFLQFIFVMLGGLMHDFFLPSAVPMGGHVHSCGLKCDMVWYEVQYVYRVNYDWTVWSSGSCTWGHSNLEISCKHIPGLHIYHDHPF
jgi:hypothetical protein